MIGQHLPTLTLPLYPGNDSLDFTSFIDHWTILHFTHAAFSAVCATELGLLAKLEIPFTSVVSVCPDSMLSLVAWIDIELSKMMDVTSIHLVSDAGHELGEQLSLDANSRAIFIIDRDGIIQAEIRQPAVVGINIDEVERVVRALQHAYETVGECTPADWQPGNPGIPPGASNIGQTWKSWPMGSKDSPL